MSKRKVVQLEKLVSIDSKRILLSSLFNVEVLKMVMPYFYANMLIVAARVCKEWQKYVIAGINDWVSNLPYHPLRTTSYWPLSTFIKLQYVELESVRGLIKFVEPRRFDNVVSNCPELTKQFNYKWLVKIDALSVDMKLSILSEWGPNSVLDSLWIVQAPVEVWAKAFENGVDTNSLEYRRFDIRHIPEQNVDSKNFGNYLISLFDALVKAKKLRQPDYDVSQISKKDIEEVHPSIFLSVIPHALWDEETYSIGNFLQHIVEKYNMLPYLCHMDPSCRRGTWEKMLKEIISRNCHLKCDFRKSIAYRSIRDHLAEQNMLDYTYLDRCIRVAFSSEIHNCRKHTRPSIAGRVCLKFEELKRSIQNGSFFERVVKLASDETIAPLNLSFSLRKSSLSFYEMEVCFPSGIQVLTFWSSFAGGILPLLPIARKVRGKNNIYFRILQCLYGESGIPSNFPLYQQKRKIDSWITAQRTFLMWNKPEHLN